MAGALLRHTLKAWEGACAGQGNPCTIKVSGATDVVAVLEGQYVPPEPPTPAAPAVGPPLSVEGFPGDCNDSCFDEVFTGTGFHPNSLIDVTFAYVTPDSGTYDFNDVLTTACAGTGPVPRARTASCPTGTRATS